MNRLMLLSFVFFCFVMFSSCEDESFDFETDVERLEEELIEVVEDRNIETCDIITVNQGSSYQEHSSLPFTIEEGMVEVKEYNTTFRYNLFYLTKYTIYSDEIKFYFNSN